MDRVKIEINNHIAIVTFNRPEKMNALDPAQFRAIIEAGEKVGKDASVRVVVLTGAGRAFCAGLDIMGLQADGEATNTPLTPRTHGLTNTFQQAAWVWRDLPVPVIAAVHGVAFGGGLQIMLGADIKYIKADTKLSVMEMKWGLIPDMGGTPTLKETMAVDHAMLLAMTGEPVTAEKALELKLISTIAEDPMLAAMELAEKLKERSPDTNRRVAVA